MSAKIVKIPVEYSTYCVGPLPDEPHAFMGHLLLIEKRARARAIMFLDSGMPNAALANFELARDAAELYREYGELVRTSNS